jgi:hypothetical protein
MKKLLLILIVSLSAACTVTHAIQKAQRRPLRKSDVALKSPAEYAKRTTGSDAQTGEAAGYDPKPRVVVVDAKSGKYAFKWVGYDGREKVVEYQRADAIDAIVSAAVSRTAEGLYLYTYRLSNLASSPTYLSSFAVQTLAADARPVKPENVYVGTMSNQIHVFAEGTWFRFADSYLGETVTPGREVEVRVVSSAPPGLVGCRVTAGNLTLKGVGEHMPSELEDAIPGYEEWPRGYTIGPVSNLASLSRQQSVEYILGKLSLFEELGWMTQGARQWYAKHLATDSHEAMLKRAEIDLKSEQITTEIHAMLHALKEK